MNGWLTGGRILWTLSIGGWAQAGKKSQGKRLYDYVIVNDDLDAAVAEAKAVILAARAERKDMCGLAGFIEQVVENQ